MDAELRAITNEKASFKYMSAHGSQFDDHFVFNATKKRMGRADYDRFLGGWVGGSVGRWVRPPLSL